MPVDSWDKLISTEKWSNVELRDSRYNQVVHLTTAANGAEEFYTTDDHIIRAEGPELARQLDDKVAQVRSVQVVTEADGQLLMLPLSILTHCTCWPCWTAI